MELIRSLVDGFVATDFESFRDAVVEAESFQEMTETTGRFGELLRGSIDPAVEVRLNELSAGSMVGSEFRGAEGFLSFWRAWLEPWETYEVDFTDWEEVDDAVLYTLHIEARGRGSGVVVRERMAQAWVVPERKVTRLEMYTSRSRALAALGGG